MFVYNPDPFVLPNFRLSPFVTAAIARHSHLLESDFAMNYFDKRFGPGNWMYVYNGREGMRLALASYNLGPEDVVTILTTSQNHYISSCVTFEISNFCQWNREIVPETKLIFVNHEFGQPYPEMDYLQSLGIPIIEDCCTTFYSDNSEKKIGTYGDFSVYSFSKFFSIQLGGILVKNNGSIEKQTVLKADEKKYINRVMSYYLSQEEQLLALRNQRYNLAHTLATGLGFSPRFEPQSDVYPYALLLKNNQIITDLQKMKLFLQSHGIQCSVFYGEDSFFIPCHQSLAPEEVSYIFGCIELYLQKQNTSHQ